jgi:hypothetical protein
MATTQLQLMNDLPGSDRSELAVVNRYMSWAVYRDGELIYNQRKNEGELEDNGLLEALGFTVRYLDMSDRAFGEQFGWHYLPPTLHKLEEAYAAYLRGKKHRELEHHRAEVSRLEVELREDN